ncbi:carbonic anhydrase 6 [Saccopteryx bilineata]|uniref:carbonic anhydrase 6 n=1 Tax=Saccopteryx bilineata TaxID=59482 RepID=UPI00338E7647
MRTLVILLSPLLLGALAEDGPRWSYSEGELAEARWPKEYPSCGGKRQSPIDLQRKKVRYNPSLKALNLTGYGSESQDGEFSMTNNGHTVKIYLPPTMRMTATNGTEYIAVEMHFHWGGTPYKISGSEHTIDGIRYAIEIHVVHYNSKYGSFDVAKGMPDGLAVLAALVEVNDYFENTYYNKFLSHLKNVRNAEQSTVLSGLDIRTMLPEDLRYYYSYRGSLTTPPCTENVQWFVLVDSVRLSRAQIWKVENSLLGYQNRTMQDNYRTTQPLNHRVVEANFMYHPKHRSDLGFELQNFLGKINSKLNYIREYIEQENAKRKSQN